MKIKLKKSLAKVVMLSLAFSIFSPMALAEAALKSSFPDVKDTSKHIAAIEYLKSNGLIGGYPDGTFKPDQTINRAEALKIVFLARQRLGKTDAVSNGAVAINFTDVKKSDWYFDYVSRAFALKIVEGYADGTFKPANDITAAESLKMVLSSVVANYQNATVTADPFSDIKVADWYAPYSAFAKNHQLIEANDDGTYLPQRKMSRTDFAELVYRTTYSEENKLDKFPMSLNWAACNNYQSGYKMKLPPDWEKIKAGDEMILWKKDKANSQVSFARVYPNSAVAVMAVDPNPQHLSLAKYMDTLEYGQGSNKQVITLNGLPYASIFIEQSGLQDSYFEMANGEILVIYAQVGDGTLSNIMKEQIRYIIGSVRDSSSASADASENCMDGSNVVTPVITTNTSSTVSTVPVAASNTDKAKLISDMLKKVLISGQSKTALEALGDQVLIDTDSIGIGTGPVDYYYSAKIDMTLKIERNTQTILASKVAKTSSF